jgi:hypothetical protein
VARVEPPEEGAYETWKAALTSELRRVAFRSLPERIPPAEFLRRDESAGVWLTSEPGIRVHLRAFGETESGRRPTRILLAISSCDSNEPISEWVRDVHTPGDVVYVCAPRGVDQTRWTRKNPPNYVERSHVLLGQTVDTGRVCDIIATARYLRVAYGENVPVHLVGGGPAGVLAAYAALWEPEIAGVTAISPPLSHMEAEAPQFLNVLRVCDIPDVLGMLAPRPLTMHGEDAAALQKVARIYTAAGARDEFSMHAAP